MNPNWQLILKRAFRLAELLVAFALLAVLMELLLVHLDRLPADPDVILIKRTKLVEVPAPTPLTPPAKGKAMPMEVAAKPGRPGPPPPTAPSSTAGNVGAEPMGTGVNNTTINFVSLLRFHHLRARFGQPTKDEQRAPQSAANFFPNQSAPFAALGARGKIKLEPNQGTAPTNSFPGATNSVVSTNSAGGFIPPLTAATRNRPASLNPPATGIVRLALP